MQPPEIRTLIDTLRDDAVALLQRLVRFPSITGNEADVGAFVAGYLRDLGLPVEIVEAEPGRPNVIAIWDSGRPGPTLLLNDHLDIVPPGPVEYWRHPPFAAEIENGRVYGRGTIDTKSGLTTLLIATRALRDARFQFRGRLKLIFTCDEETGGTLGMQHLGKTGHLTADLAVVAEPTTLKIEIGTKGRLGVEIATRGVATHGARPWLGHNAIEDMAEIVGELRILAADLHARRHPVMGPPSLNIGTVAGGAVPNMVPNWCRLGVDRRLVPGETRAQALAEIETAIAAARARNPKLDASVEEKIWWPGYLMDAGHPLIGAVARSYETVVGSPPAIGVKDAGTDASWIHTLAGIPVVMFSPGDGLNAMNVDENVSIDDMMLATQVIAQIVIDVLGDPAA
jgi:acetylornithine deacetylase/succinyl-diaminopimelate desuccinylase family protein